MNQTWITATPRARAAWAALASAVLIVIGDHLDVVGLDAIEQAARATGATVAADLEFGSRLAKRVFRGRFLCGSVPQRMVEFTRRSPRFANVMQDLFAGTQPYVGLKRRLMKNFNGSLVEIVCNLGLGRMIPGRDTA